MSGSTYGSTDILRAVGMSTTGVDPDWKKSYARSMDSPMKLLVDRYSNSQRVRPLVFRPQRIHTAIRMLTSGYTGTSSTAWTKNALQESQHMRNWLSTS